MIATDIAARGIDIHQLPQVVNFDLPNVPADYVHRIGRTGRAGMLGHAISLVSADEIEQLQDIERLIQKHVVREVVDGFAPQNPLPKSRDILPPKVNKPKKPKSASSGNSNNANNRKPAANSGARRSGTNSTAGNSASKPANGGQTRQRRSQRANQTVEA